jgi:predicted AlkP superfamily phosphohydrolase/phosphomutase
MMTPGMDAHHTEPPSIEKEINERFPDYAFLISWQKYLGREDVFLERITRLFESRIAMLDYLMEHQWDLLLFVLMEIDSAQHCFWGTEVIKELYRKADALVSRLLDRADAGEFDLVVISDHGFARVDKWIHVNSFLADVGYLAFKSAIGAPRARLEGLVAGLSNRIMKTSAMKAVMAHVSDEAVESVFKAFGKGKFEKRNEPCPFDWSRTVAFMTSYYGCIYLDRESVFEGGTVSEEDAAGLKAEISNALMNIRDPETGEKVIKDVLDAGEVYTGPYTASAPDLLAIPAPGYAFSPMRSKRTIQRNNFLSGEHHPDGVFMAYGPDISAGRLSGLWVGDVAPTALHAMGAGIPDDMDGSVLVETFRVGSEPREREPRRYSAETPLSVKSRIDRLKQEGKL